MQVNIENHHLNIQLAVAEKIVSIKGSLRIPLHHITEATTKRPETCWWRDIRLPGTYFPGLIKAGTYYTRNGREFWLVTRGKKYLTVELENESYKRIVLGTDNSEYWSEKINKAITKP